jgi:hypothetical protein
MTLARPIVTEEPLPALRHICVEDNDAFNIKMQAEQTIVAMEFAVIPFPFSMVATWYRHRKERKRQS